MQRQPSGRGGEHGSGAGRFADRPAANALPGYLAFVVSLALLTAQCSDGAATAADRAAQADADAAATEVAGVDVAPTDAPLASPDSVFPVDAAAPLDAPDALVAADADSESSSNADSAADQTADQTADQAVDQAAASEVADLDEGADADSTGPLADGDAVATDGAAVDAAALDTADCDGGACPGVPAGLCDPCTSTAACTTAESPSGSGDQACIRYGNSGAWCGVACNSAKACPTGYACVVAATVEGPASQQCVRTGADGTPFAQCPCSPVAVSKQLSTACASPGLGGSCPGKRSCTVDGLTACDAPNWATETCNGVDDDCDGATDEGFDPAAFCVGIGAPMHFTDVAAKANVAAVNFGRGSAFVDFDGDGLLDIAQAVAGPKVLLKQLPNHTFADIAAAWGAPMDAETWGALAADFDNDGDPDLLFVNGGMGPAATNVMLRNDILALGSFTDVSAWAGNITEKASGSGATALDYDRDGDLDVFLTPGGGFGESNPKNKATNRLMRNDGNLHFTDVSAQAGLTAVGPFIHCGVGDFDNDGWPDVGAGNLEGDNVLYHNNGDGTFVDIAAAAGVTSPNLNFGFVVDDFDNDGWLDIFLPKRTDQAGAVAGELYLNQTNGKFALAATLPTEATKPSTGVVSGDLNGDGYPDLYIGTAQANTVAFDRLFMVRPALGSAPGKAGVWLDDVSAASGIDTGILKHTHGSTLGDYDGDGDTDVFVSTGGPVFKPETAQPNILWNNDGNGHHWLAVELHGTCSNRSAVGARSAVALSDGRVVHRMVAAGEGFTNTLSPIQHFGLGMGSGATATSLDVLWPSGIRQRVLAPAMHKIRHLSETGVAVAGTAALGKPLMAKVCGPAGSIATLALKSTVPGLQLADLTKVAAVKVGGYGGVPLPLQIPADPALKGARVRVLLTTSLGGAVVDQGFSEFVIQ